MQRRRERLRYSRGLARATPTAMITAATERRLAGDWRGACAAALVDVQVDLRDVASSYGAAHAGRIEAELTGLAPDLLRRFLPRRDGRLLAGGTVVLSRYDEPCRAARAGRRNRVPVLVAAPPRSWREVRQSVTLRVCHDLPGSFYDLPGWTWRADAVAERRWVYGAGDDRLPWHFPDGSPHPPGTAPLVTGVLDRPGQVERMAALLTARRPVEAFEAAGFAVDLNTGQHPSYVPELPVLLNELGATLAVARAEYLRLSARYEQSAFSSATRTVGVPANTIRRQGWASADSGPYVFAVPAPSDVALLRFGDLTPDEVHPLVHEALFPGRSQQWRTQTPPPPDPIRVRCGSAWHTVVPTGAQLRTPHHDDAEIRREFVLAGLGGPMSGCAAALRAWRTGARPIPKDVRKDRQELFTLALYGDTDGLLARLAGGIDAGLRGPGGGTLLHWLAHVDHTRVLPLLLAAGVPVDTRDHEGRTALHAAAESAATDTMAALVAVGVDPRARDNGGRTAAEVLAQVPGH